MDEDVEGEGFGSAHPPGRLDVGEGGPIRFVEIDVLPDAGRQPADIAPIPTDLCEDDRSELVRWGVGTVHEDVDEKLRREAVDGWRRGRARVDDCGHRRCPGEQIGRRARQGEVRRVRMCTL